MLSYAEYRTIGIYNASSTALSELDMLQTRFIHALGLNDEAALLYLNLAPLHTRRDIAILGFIHRAVLRKGPQQLHQFFELGHVRGVHPTR